MSCTDYSIILNITVTANSVNLSCTAPQCFIGIFFTVTADGTSGTFDHGSQGPLNHDDCITTVQYVHNIVPAPMIMLSAYCGGHPPRTADTCNSNCIVLPGAEPTTLSTTLAIEPTTTTESDTTTTSIIVSSTYGEF